MKRAARHYPAINAGNTSDLAYTPAVSRREEVMLADILQRGIPRRRFSCAYLTRGTCHSPPHGEGRGDGYHNVLV